MQELGSTAFGHAERSGPRCYQPSLEKYQSYHQKVRFYYYLYGHRKILHLQLKGGID